MLARIAAFEAGQQLRSPLFAVAFALFFLLTFGSVTLDQIQIGSRGNVHINAPFAILQTVGIMNVFGLFVVTAFVANVVIRDDETGFAPLVRATPVRRLDLLIGRFVGAYAVALAVMCSVPLALLVGSLMPWLDAEKLGPFVAGHYLGALGLSIAPTLLVMACGFFALATVTRSMMWTYVGLIGFLVLFVTSRVMLREPGWETLAALSDPFGLSALNHVTRYWTAEERNTRLPELAGVLLGNRALWLAIGLTLFALACARFRFEVPARAPSRRERRAAARAEADRSGAPAPGTTALPAPRADAATRRAQAWALTRFDMNSVFRSPAFFVLLAIGLFNSLGALSRIVEVRSTQFFPVTRAVIEALEGSFGIIPLIIAIYYAGELVWRDRQQRFHEIVDATAAPAWAHLMPKVLAIAGVLAATYAVAMVGGMLFQLAHGYTRLEPEAYLLWLVLPGVVGSLLIAVLAVFVQVLVPAKPLGWAVMLVHLVATITLASLGFEHNLYHYGGTPPVPLSDMNGMGRFWQGRLWFQAYWLAFALMLAVLAHALWRRGSQDALRPRLARLGTALRGTPAWLLGGGALAWASLGGWIFWNTNVLNTYLPATEQEAQQAAYEKALLAHEKLPQPAITQVKLAVQLFPREARALTEGEYTLENRSGQALQDVHVRWDPKLKMERLELPGATLAQDLPQFQYRIYRYATPLQPGEQRALRFASRLEEPGFVNNRPLTRIVPNGTFLDNTEIAPLLGMDRSGLLQDRSKRRKHGLPAELRMAKLEDDSARAHHYLRHDSDWVQAELTVSTDADQTVVAPGTALSDTVQGGRRTLVTRTEAPIHHFFSVQSARYAVTRDEWRPPQGGEPVALAVYHHPVHGHNVPRMLDAVKASLDVFGERFSRYQFRQSRILEFPAYASFAQAFAGTVPYAESIGFVQNHRDDDEKIDLVTYVTAHEIAHQWWAHQVIGADQQGSTMLSESFAQYGAMLVMEKLYGAPMMRKFLKLELDRYLRARGGEVVEELPLVRVENQPYIHYEKGSLVMWWAREALGEAVVNRALQRLLQRYAFQPAPYPNAADFVALLRDEAGPDHQALITDLFEKITLYDMKAQRATARQRDDGRWEVQLTLSGRKLYADGRGKETEAPLGEMFEVGVFDAEPGKRGFRPASVLALQRTPLVTGEQTVTLLTDRRPSHAGVDPFNKRIDRNSDDNLVRIE